MLDLSLLQKCSDTSWLVMYHIVISLNMNEHHFAFFILFQRDVLPLILLSPFTLRLRLLVNAA